MKKKEAVSLFGKRQTELARAVNRTKAAICQWPDELNEDQTNLVIGAAIRAGKKVPKRCYVVR